MFSSSHQCIVAPRLSLAAVAAVALLAGASANAAAQTPTPPPSDGGPPSADVPPPPPPPTEPPPGVNPPAGDGPPQHEAPNTTGDSGAVLGEDAIDGAAPPVVKPLVKAVSLRGGTLRVPIGCRASGSATLRARRQTIDRARFKCVEGGARVTFRVSGRRERRLRRAKRIVVHFRVGTESVQAKLKLVKASPRPSKVVGHAAQAAAADDWRIGSHICGNRYSIPQGLSVDAGYLHSINGRPDYVRYRILVWGDQRGWVHVGRYSNWTYVPAIGGMTIGGLDMRGTRPDGMWVAVAVQKQWWYANTAPHYWTLPRAESSTSATSGYWCWWSA